MDSIDGHFVFVFGSSRGCSCCEVASRVRGIGPVSVSESKAVSISRPCAISICLSGCAWPLCRNSRHWKVARTLKDGLLRNEDRRSLEKYQLTSPFQSLCKSITFVVITGGAIGAEHVGLSKPLVQQYFPG